jgi:hypothetical protein
LDPILRGGVEYCNRNLISLKTQTITEAWDYKGKFAQLYLSNNNNKIVEKLEIRVITLFVEAKFKSYI